MKVKKKTGDTEIKMGTPGSERCHLEQRKPMERN
jgi:hypothetical protein